MTGLVVGLWAIAGLVTLVVILAHLDPPQAPQEPATTCPHCHAPGRAADGGEGLLRVCPRCWAHWTTTEEE